MNEFKHIFNYRRRYFYPEALLSLYLLIFTIGGPGIARYATRAGLLGVIVLAVEILMRGDSNKFMFSLRPILPYFCFMLLSLAVIPLIPYAGVRVWNNFTGLITIISIFYIVKRNGQAPLLEFTPLLLVYGLCGSYVFLPSALTASSAGKDRMRVGIEALGHEGSGMGASQISLVVGIGAMFGIYMLIKYNVLNISVFKSLFKFFVLFGIVLGAYAIIRYSGSRQGVVWISIVMMSYILVKNSNYLIFAAGLSLTGGIIFLAILLMYFQNLGVVERVMIFFDPLRQFEVEKSFMGRKDMILNGIKWWLESPIWGNGNEAFRVFNGGTYSHNNYIELLVNYGVLGAAFFYIPLFICLFGSLRYIKHPKESVRLPSIWIVISVISILVSNIFLPSYYMRSMLFFYSYLVGYYAYLKYSLRTHGHTVLDTPYLSSQTARNVKKRSKAYAHV